MNIAVLVSGGGSYITKLIEHSIVLDCVVADRKCKAIDIAQSYAIETFQVSKNDSNSLKKILLMRNTFLVVLVGFLSILDKKFINMFTVIKVHPALLPNYGGRGMHGMRIHRAVLASGDKFSGCTVHYVNEGIDTGKIIAQTKVDISTATTAEEIYFMVIQQEWILLPKVIKKIISL